jgi:uncharacterized protein (DUF58 family)
VSPLARYLESALRILVLLGFSAAALVALFFAWWVAVGAALGYVIYVAARRVLPRTRARAGRTEVIEGEFRVERDEPPPPGER